MGGGCKSGADWVKIWWDKINNKNGKFEQLVIWRMSFHLGREAEQGKTSDRGNSPFLFGYGPASDLYKVELQTLKYDVLEYQGIFSTNCKIPAFHTAC